MALFCPCRETCRTIQEVQNQSKDPLGEKVSLQQSLKRCFSLSVIGGTQMIVWRTMPQEVPLSERIPRSVFQEAKNTKLATEPAQSFGKTGSIQHPKGFFSLSLCETPKISNVEPYNKKFALQKGFQKVFKKLRTQKQSKYPDIPKGEEVTSSILTGCSVCPFRGTPKEGDDENDDEFIQ